ncbi:MAG: hypothetical protein A2351_05360 [Omnitrophica bacterium RIFOXYB12_FULL_50_7]|nr:MAG: hypothetical protein A2351_05360 [Omnitrophica bacterium RIFOXYB12_FULL_50_7]
MCPQNLQRRYPLKKTLAVLFILFLLTSPCQAADPLTVTKVIDGATLELSNGEEVRLIGVNFHAEDAQGKGAAEFTRKLVEGKQIRLEYDVQKKDKYGRTLAYVYVVTNTSTAVEINMAPGFYLVPGEKFYEDFLNATIIRSGYAQVMTIQPNVKYQDLFVKLEKEARESKRGLWI